MIDNRKSYFEENGQARPEALMENPWLRYLVGADQPYWNAERIGSMAEKAENAALDYTLRTLDLLDEYDELDDRLYAMIRTALCWSEVAKGGTAEDRARWLRRGYPLDIHNQASALIYADHVHVRDRNSDPVYLMILTHGLAGQYIRGECAMADSAPLQALASRMPRQRFCRMLDVLNACIIRAVGEGIWQRVKDEIYAFSRALYDGAFAELPARTRIEQLLPGLVSAASEAVIAQAEQTFVESVFPRFDLWYFESALSPFGLRGAVRLTALAAKAAGDGGIRHLNFKPLADAMYYDYDGKKHVNTYKQRIVERWLEDPDGYGQHVALSVEPSGECLRVGIRFTPVCARLIDFCVEAERSGLLTYEKSITMLYDTFGFRRDAFDRLNNEEKYLSTMNSAEDSTKLSILDFVTGDSALDVGSGGGVLLDALEARYPALEVIGTDISQNVIEVLRRRKAAMDRRWTAEVHNFVDAPFPRRVDNIIFSSILHEIYSYTDLGRGRFDKRSLETALRNAAESLKPGGRIIIRDGVKTPGRGRLRIRFKTAEGMTFFRQFLKDFHGMDGLSDDEKVSEIDEARQEVLTDINFGREFLYTYTWGSESFAHECQECFGYYELDEFRRKLEGLGFKIIEARSLLETGYVEHLSPLVSLTDERGNEMPFPDSNSIVVAEKSI